MSSIQNTIGNIRIPALPDVVIKVMQYDYQSEKASTAEVARIISPDKGICTEILRVANSAYYGRSGKVKTMLDAVTLLGMKTLKNLVIFLGTKKLFGTTRDPVFVKYLQEYPILSALYARELTMPMKNEELSNTAFLGGLLHKVGMSVLAVTHGEHYSYLIQESFRNGFDIKELERKAYGTDHVAIGLAVAESWKLPTEIKQVIPVDALTEPELLTGPLEAVTALSSFFGFRAAGVKISVKEEFAAAALSRLPNLQTQKPDFFLTEQYVTKIKSHPYYEMAMR